MSCPDSEEVLDPASVVSAMLSMDKLPIRRNTEGYRDCALKVLKHSFRDDTRPFLLFIRSSFHRQPMVTPEQLGQCLIPRHACASDLSWIGTLSKTLMISQKN